METYNAFNTSYYSRSHVNLKTMNLIICPSKNVYCFLQLYQPNLQRQTTCVYKANTIIISGSLTFSERVAKTFACSNHTTDLSGKQK